MELRLTVLYKVLLFLITVFQERDSAVELWHLALCEVDNLEEALRSCHDNRHMDLAQKKNEDVCWMSVTDFVT